MRVFPPLLGPPVGPEATPQPDCPSDCRSGNVARCTRCARTAEEAGELQILVVSVARSEGYCCADCSETYCCEDCQAPLRVKACAHCGRLAVPGLLAYVEDAAPGYHVCEDCEYGPPSVALAAAARVEAFRALQAGEASRA